MLAAGNKQCIDHALARDQRPAGTLQLGIEETDIERRVVDHEWCISKKRDQIVGNFREKEFVFQELIAEAVDCERLRGHAALWIEIAVKRLPGRYPVDQLDAADLDQTMAVEGIETRGLGIEHNLAH